MVVLSVERKGKSPIQIELNSVGVKNLTVGELRAAVSNRAKLSPERIRLTTKDKKPLKDDNATLQDSAIQDGDALVLKDLGPQISWRLVYLIEYLGPLLINPLIYQYGPKYIYKQEFQRSKVQEITLSLVVLHYLKRELETMFIHRFSKGTMPFAYVFRNSAHYWILSGIVFALPVYGPWYSSSALAGTIFENPTYLKALVGVWTFAQLSNLYCHLNLASLRPNGSTQRQIPYGYGFNLVSCPNYFFESLGWAAVTCLTGSWAAGLFWVVGTSVMAQWAIGKHRRYKKEFGDKYPKNRKAMFPFIL